MEKLYHRKTGNPVELHFSTSDTHFHEKIENSLGSLEPQEKIPFLLHVSRQLNSHGDRATSLLYIKTAELEVLENNLGVSSMMEVAKHYLRLNADGLAVTAVALAAISSNDLLSYDEKERLLSAAMLGAVGIPEHGHYLLLMHLSSVDKLSGKTVVEIGTTRENVPGQGSTEKLARFCKTRGMLFTTVDVDPRNTSLAKRTFDVLNIAADAVTMKGEDYLRSGESLIDYAFLDAYDFDHGGHSAVRQNRYKSLLGSEISNRDCHIMHLECAKALSSRLADDGAICIDDTWRNTVNGRWEAKGTLAVPYLLEEGFEVISEGNNAVLLQRRAPHILPE